jgi:glycosyltransferase involved in cell wall biosynthesis
LLVSLARTIDSSRASCRAAYLLPAKTHLVAELAAAGVESICLNAVKPRDLAWAGRLRRLVQADEVDVVHIHAPYPAAVVRPVLRALGRSRPAIVYTEHNTWDGYGLVTRWANALTYPLDDARLAVSEATRESIPRRLRGETEVLVHGVELETVRAHWPARQRVRAQLEVDDRTTLVVTVANLRPDKDYPTLLRAAKRTLETGAAIRFAAVGQGPLEKELRAEATRLGLGDGFRFLGFRSDALDLLAGADLFALSSRAEGYPVSVMEALALGVPVVATTVGGIPEAVRSGVEGILVPVSRPDLLAGALMELARDPRKRSRMSAAATERSAWFDIRRSTTRIQAVYEEVAARVIREPPR